MQVRVLVLPYLPSEQRFDDAALLALQRQVEVVSCRSAFFRHAGQFFWSVLVSCQVPISRRSAGAVGRGAQGRGGAAGPSRDPDRAEPSAASGASPSASAASRLEIQVTAEDRPLYEALRSWRAEVADHWGVPVFLVLTNRQLAEIVRVKPRSLSALGSLPGIGPSRLKKLGRQILELLGVEPPPDTAPDSASDGPVEPTLLPDQDPSPTESTIAMVEHEQAAAGPTALF